MHAWRECIGRATTGPRYDTAMRLLWVLLLVPSVSLAQATLKPIGKRPPLDALRREMATPSAGDVRGQLDGTGYPSQAQTMARVWDLAAQRPAPESLGPLPPSGLLAAIAPHDDYTYAARVERQI